jgi:hypothetical protein
LTRQKGGDEDVQRVLGAAQQLAVPHSSPSGFLNCLDTQMWKAALDYSRRTFIKQDLQRDALNRSNADFENSRILMA